MLGDGGQSEHQKPVFILKPGAQLKNVQVSGPDGVHAMGDAKLANVWWRDVGENAFTMKGPGHVEIEGGGAFNAADKIVQLNHGGSFSLNNFTADTFGKAIRTTALELKKDAPLCAFAIGEIASLSPERANWLEVTFTLPASAQNSASVPLAPGLFPERSCEPCIAPHMQ